MKHYVLCLTDGDEVVQQIAEKITEAGFGREKIFIFTPDRENPENTGQGGEEDSGLFREGVGLMAGIGPAIVGGAGNFMGAGKIMNVADRADNIGAEPANAAAFLAHFDLSESAAREYQSKLAEGGTLVAVLVEDQKMATSVRTIFEENHGQEISEV
jgi:hypothetical protein